MKLKSIRIFLFLNEIIIFYLYKLNYSYEYSRFKFFIMECNSNYTVFSSNGIVIKIKNNIFIFAKIQIYFMAKKFK